MRNEIAAATRFFIDWTSPTGLRWKYRRGSRKAVGDIAGMLNKVSGYYMVETNGVTYSVARIIYTLAYGEIPDNCVIDHFDGIKTNNLLSNLRCVTQKVNTQNTGFSAANTSGVKGTHYKEKVLPGGSVYRCWVATWREGGKNRSKEFSLASYSDAKRTAAEFRASTINRLVESGESYTERHGSAQ